MSTENVPQGPDTIVGSIENQADPSQRVDIKYVQEDNAFVTSGIQTHFAEKEIFIPAYLVVTDFQLMGAICIRNTGKTLPGPGGGNHLRLCASVSGAKQSLHPCGCGAIHEAVGGGIGVNPFI